MRNSRQNTVIQACPVASTLLVFLGLLISCFFSPVAAEDLTRLTEVGELLKDEVMGRFSPELSPDGQLLAVNNANNLQVWTLKEGNLDRKIWSSRDSFPKSVITAFAWCGQNLLISKLDSNSSKPLGNLSQLPEKELFSILRSKGNTVQLDPVKNASKIVLGSAYNAFSIDTGGRYIAAATPNTQKDVEGTIIDFFRIDSGRTQATSVGQFKNPNWPKLRQFPYIIGWDLEGNGIFVVAANNRGGEGYRQILVHINSKGESKEVLPERASIIPTAKKSLPLCVPLNNNSLAVFVTFMNQAEAYVVYARNKPLQTISLRDINRIVSDVVKTFQVLSITPNGRFIIIQDYGKDGSLQSGQVSPLWAVDLKTKRRHKMISLPELLSAYQWSQNSLLIEFAKKEKEQSVRRIGLLSFELAALPEDDPKIEKAIAGPDWENAPAPIVEQPISVVTASKFLQGNMIAPVKLPSHWSKSMSRNTEGSEKIAYALGAPNIDGNYVVVDTKKNRVVEFNAGLTNLPQSPEPITPEKAKDIAKEFVNSQLPMFQQETEIQIDVEPFITSQATYIVHLKGGNLKGDILGVDVEVRASDGKIWAYREYTAANIKQQKPTPSIRQPLIKDFLPRFSPDGRKIAFYSNRPREGYPLWWPERPNALFIVNADGTNLQIAHPNVGRGQSSSAHWSPNGRWLAYFTEEGIFVYDVVGKKSIMVPPAPEKTIEPKLWGWLPQDKLLLGWLHNGPGGNDLVTWEPAKPNEQPQVLIKDWSDRVGNDYAYGLFALSPDGKTLVFTWRVREQDATSQCSSVLFNLSVANLNSTPKKIVPCLPSVSYLRWNSLGLLVAGEQAFLVDPLSGQKTSWQLPEGLSKSMKRPFAASMLKNSDLSTDGRSLVFPDYVPVINSEVNGSYLLHMADINTGEITKVKVDDNILMPKH
jgi:hypothetical protein